MTRGHIYLVPAGLMLVAFTTAGAAPVQRGTGALADTDVRSVRSVQSSPVRIEEAPLFRIDPRRPPAAMIGDMDRRATVADAPRSIREEKTRR